MEQHRHFLWRNYHLTATIHYPTANIEPSPLLIICHGFTSNRIGIDRLFVKSAQALAARNYTVLRFDYAGCGESEGIYGDLCFADFISQTKAAISFAQTLPGVDPSHVTLLGHSLGGAVAVQTAHEDQRVKDVILWAAVGQPFHDIVAIIGEEEYKRVLCTGSVDHLGYSLSTSFLQSLQHYHPLKNVQELGGNILCIHGTADDDIPFAYCQDYYEAAQARSTGSAHCKLIAGANHTFSSIAHFHELIETTNRWLTNHSHYDSYQAEG
ncbi:PGAP1 family protein [Fictibacillus macauensis ZFHKF-1]|uniref:PGAP1 family protein n=1 Tax=Fictibacillus macauensis ZFHKF-1 TaxID=1196324 RepID=I8AKB0_9BACL|nr:alpha/beta hydrolase [Fictibacillus macauensis]EIT86287.1 PGAP1 family protein [Fictibacillus macauensis ZFHKF-1]